MTEENICENIENDEFFRTFLSPEVQSSLSISLSVAEQVQKLGEGIDSLNKELLKEVKTKHDDLLNQASHASKIENILNTMKVHIECLFANIERLKFQILGPYQALETHTKILSHLHLASHILRRVNRIQQLSKRLNGIHDPVQQATIIQELVQLASDPELDGIDVVTSELRTIKNQQQKVIKLASSSLRKGMLQENIVQCTTAIQIFINLGTAKIAIESLVDEAINECCTSLKVALEINQASVNSNKQKVGPGKASVTSSQGFRGKIWTALEKTFAEDIYQQCKQIKFIQSLITDLNSNQLKEDCAESFWKLLCRSIIDEFKNTPSAVQQTLETEYPKLLKCFSDMIKRLNYTPFNFNRTVFEIWENAYLSSSLTRLLSPVQSMFEAENTPTHDQIDSLIHVITGELSVALVDDSLNQKIARNVSKCMRLFSVKTESLIATGPDAVQVIAGAINGSQQLNVRLANNLHYLQSQLSRMLTNMGETLPNNTVKIIDESFESLNNLTMNILQPLIVSINSTIATIVITIHLETDWTKLPVPKETKIAASCSPYMRELTQFISRTYQTYLASFSNSEILNQKCNEIAIFTIELLVRHVALLRPITEGGRLRLQSDFGYLETALKSMCPYLTDLGKPYRLMKSMATLVTMQPKEIVETQASGSSVPHSTILFMLFSYAGSELASPHQTAAWSITKLSAWLDEHPNEGDRLDLIAGALQRYVTLIRQNNSVNFDPVYPIMSSLLETAVKAK